MKFINNTGNNRVIDSIRPWLQSRSQLDIASAHYSLFAFAELAAHVAQLSQVRLIVPPFQTGVDTLGLLGSETDIAWRNKLQSHWFARQFADWLNAKAQVRQAKGSIPQGTLVLRDSVDVVQQAVLGAFAFTTDGLGMAPGNPLSLIQQSDTGAEALCVQRDPTRVVLRDSLFDGDVAKTNLTAILRQRGLEDVRSL